MTKSELIVQGMGLVLLVVLVVCKAGFWMCAMKKPKDRDLP